MAVTPVSDINTLIIPEKRANVLYVTTIYSVFKELEEAIALLTP